MKNRVRKWLIELIREALAPQVVHALNSYMQYCMRTEVVAPVVTALDEHYMENRNKMDVVMITLDQFKDAINGSRRR
jgi:hypothetical protein